MKAGLLAWLVRLITGVRPAQPNTAATAAPRVYYANHSSHLDFVVIWAALPAPLRQRARPVAAADYWRRGPLRRWLAASVFKAVLIPRGKTTRDDDPVGRMTAALDAGAHLIFFPEGTRSLDGDIGAFKPGLHHLARHHPRLQLIPVYLQNLNRILPKGEFLMVPLMGNVVFGEPCDGPRPGESRHQFLTRARHALLDLSQPSRHTAHPPQSPPA